MRCRSCPAQLKAFKIFLALAALVFFLGGLGKDKETCHKHQRTHKGMSTSGAYLFCFGFVVVACLVHVCPHKHVTCMWLCAWLYGYYQHALRHPILLLDEILHFKQATCIHGVASDVACMCMWWENDIIGHYWKSMRRNETEMSML